jgi:hypothetical protein
MVGKHFKTVKKEAAHDKNQTKLNFGTTLSVPPTKSKSFD